MVQTSRQRLTTRDDSILIALSPILTLVYHCLYCNMCVNVSLAENVKKTDQSRNVGGQFHHGNWWRVLSNSTIDSWGYNTAKHFVRFLQLKLFFKKKLWSDVPSIRQDISWTGAQPSLVAPDNASLHTPAAAQSVNIDGSGLRIRIPVLKRKREKEWVRCSSISTLKAHLLSQRYNWGVSSKEIQDKAGTQQKTYHYRSRGRTASKKELNFSQSILKAGGWYTH